MAVTPRMNEHSVMLEVIWKMPVCRREPVEEAMCMPEILRR